ncbi:MAG: very short patch repair endonuclease [Nitrosomonas sp.]|nr:very short patch repair endonuclease [Nitrosomonas sp.]
MTDTLLTKERSERMRLVKSKNTRPELTVRKLCRKLGYRGYRLHRKDLPGKPDIAFMGRKIAIFVHGCFWHGHNCHGKIRYPKSNQDYWLPKIKRNEAKDAENMAWLVASDWQVIVIWECETKHVEQLASKLANLLAS